MYVAARRPVVGRHLPAVRGPLLTGWWCPGCGLTRAAHHLLHGDIGRAHGYNALVVPFVVLLALTWIAWLMDSRGRRPAWVHRAVIPAWLGLAIVAVMFAIAAQPAVVRRPAGMTADVRPGHAHVIRASAAAPSARVAACAPAAVVGDRRQS